MQLKERLELITDTVTPYKMASVIYFDSSENPCSFDYKYAFKKIEKWKKENVGVFFSSMPINKWMPTSLLSPEILETYMRVTKEIDQEHYKTIMDSISTISSEIKINKETLSTLNLEKSII